MFDAETIATIETVAREAGLEPPALLAVAEVESGGRAFHVIDGRREPPIRFEGHYFDQRLAGEARDRARAAGLSSPTPGAVANPRGQAARWALIERAASIDRKAAWESVSWGIGQVMGAHWSWLGHPNVESLVEEARGGVAGQVRLMLRYIEKAGLTQALQSRDWATFARGYNGPGYRRNRYDTRMAEAYARHAARKDGAAAVPPQVATVLGRGASGEAVRKLQERLCAAGLPVARDGVFGPATEAAVKAFQRRAGLVADGIAGPGTIAALSALPDVGTGDAFWRRILAAIDAWLGRD